MRKVVLQEFVTLNGLAAGLNDSVAYIPASTGGDRTFGEEQFKFLDSIDTILLGRVTYLLFSAYWPNVTEGDDKPFADKLNATRKVVFSKTLDGAPWGKWEEATVVKARAADEVAKLKRQAGKDMVLWGSISLAQSLIREGLVDEYRLVVCPLVLGSGRPLFEGSGASIDLKLLDARPLDRGAVSLKYVASDGR